MREKRHNGIILKTFFEKKQKVIILDEMHGKIECVPAHTAISAGSFISYILFEKGTVYFAKEIQLHDMPLDLARDNVLFLHYILELIYLSAPFGQKSPELFSFLVYIYDNQINFVSDKQLLVVFKLFVIIGLWPEHVVMHDDIFVTLCHVPIDTLLDYPLDLKITHKLYDWISECSAQHPLLYAFKTVHFLQLIGPQGNEKQ